MASAETTGEVLIVGQPGSILFWGGGGTATISVVPLELLIILDQTQDHWGWCMIQSGAIIVFNLYHNDWLKNCHVIKTYIVSVSKCFIYEWVAKMRGWTMELLAAILADAWRDLRGWLKPFEKFWATESSHIWGPCYLHIQFPFYS